MSLSVGGFLFELRSKMMSSKDKRQEIIEEYYCQDRYGEQCDDCNYCKECLQSDLNDLEEVIRVDERKKTLNEVIENVIPTLYEHNVHQVTIDNVKSLIIKTVKES